MSLRAVGSDRPFGSWRRGRQGQGRAASSHLIGQLPALETRVTTPPCRGEEGLDISIVPWPIQTRRNSRGVGLLLINLGHVFGLGLALQSRTSAPAVIASKAVKVVKTKTACHLSITAAINGATSAAEQPLRRLALQISSARRKLNDR